MMKIEAIFGGILALFVLAVAAYAIISVNFRGSYDDADSNVVVLPQTSASESSGLCQCFEEGFKLAGSNVGVMSSQYRTGFEQCRAVLGVAGSIETAMPLLSSVAVNYLASDTRLETTVEIPDNSPMVEAVRTGALKQVTGRSAPVASAAPVAPVTPVTPGAAPATGASSERSAGSRRLTTLHHLREIEAVEPNCIRRRVGAAKEVDLLLRGGGAIRVKRCAGNETSDHVTTLPSGLWADRWERYQYQRRTAISR